MKNDISKLQRKLDPQLVEKRKMKGFKKCDKKEKNFILKIIQNYSKLIMTSQTKQKDVLNKKTYVTISETGVGVTGVTTVTSLSLTGDRTSIGVLFAVCTSFLTGVTTMITYGYFSKTKLRYTKTEASINMISILYEKTITKSMMDKKN